MTKKEMKSGILKMFWLMKQFCENHHNALSEEEPYMFHPLKIGYEFKCEDNKFQLVLELKEV